MRSNVETVTSNALIIFRSLNSDNYRLSLLTTDYKRVGKKTEKELSNPRRFSFFLGPDAKVKTPEEFLIKKGAVADIEDLKSRFSVEVVNKEFYLRIADLFYRFIKEAKYPRDSRKKEFAVKLIGRIIFCWFLKKKKSANGIPLIPEELLSLRSLENFSDYFHSVLEPLFFEVLNTPKDKRKFESLLRIYEFSQTIPFLNGGLFEPDNDDIYKKGNGTFGVIEIDDAWFHDLFELLEMYNFTINENSPLDMELSIDPEMLGRVFENLLAEINPETGETARNATGSFYTPRPIVEYMVDESLKAYLSSNVEIEEETLNKLLSWSDETLELSKEQKTGVLNALDKMKSIDPACGSGAFPMGILQKTALILEKVDPDSIEWVMRMVERIPDSVIRQIVEDQLLNEDWSYKHKLGIIQNSIYGIDIQPIAVEISKLRFFLSLIVDTKINDSAPNRGVKPLPNLEFKIVCADAIFKSPEKETFSAFFEREPFFVRLEELVKDYFNASNDVKKEKLKEEIKSHINKKVKDKTDEINSILKPAKGTKFEQIWGEKKKAEVGELNRELELWDSYTNIFNHQKVEFFDTRYFFPDVKDGFDIVIGNPPYIQLQNNNGYLGEKYKDQGYVSFAKTGDIYALFYERGNELLKDGGHLCYITSNKWMRAKYGEKLRGYLIKNTSLEILIDFGDSRIFNATTYTNILLLKKGTHQIKTRSWDLSKVFSFKSSVSDMLEKNEIGQSDFSLESFLIIDKSEASIKEKIEGIGTPLKDWDIQINYGIKTGFNEAFIIDGATKNRLIKEDPKSAEIIKPILRGRDIKKYKAEFADQWLIFIPWHFPLHKDESIQGASELAEKAFQKQYPSIYGHLLNYKEQLLKRNQAETGIRYEWYSLQRCAATYYEEFEKEKIVWLEMSPTSNFTIDVKNSFILNTAYMMTGKDIKFICAVLNSKVLDKYFSFITTEIRGGTRRYTNQYVENFPVPQISKEQQKPFETMVDFILFAKEKGFDAEADIFEQVVDNMVYDLYFADSMKNADCYITDRIVEMIEPFDENESDDSKTEYIKLLAQAFKKDKTVQRCIIYSRIVKEVKTITGGNKDE
ncbi:MAG TPA: TaqI-like C-terminal specificity domain-containing protein [bacterium]|nr:TaqI-like C-terminal specificity domain-containing protein [bacterium]